MIRMKLEFLRTPAMILACGCLILCIAFGARAGMGLYLKPMGLEYGWGREIFSFALALQKSRGKLNEAQHNLTRCRARRDSAVRLQLARLEPRERAVQIAQ